MPSFDVRCCAPVALGALVFAVTASTPFRASATTIVPQSIQSMTERADLIVIATPKAGSSVATWDAAHRFIVTRTTLVVAEVLHGSATPGSEIVLETLGGFIDAENIGMGVPGAPAFEAGQDVLVFLTTDPQGIRRTLDLSAGKFEIVGTGAQRSVTRNDLGAADVLGSAGASPERLDDLKAAISTALSEQAARGKGVRP